MTLRQFNGDFEVMQLFLIIGKILVQTTSQSFFGPYRTAAKWTEVSFSLIKTNNYKDFAMIKVYPTHCLRTFTPIAQRNVHSYWPKGVLSGITPRKHTRVCEPLKSLKLRSQVNFEIMRKCMGNRKGAPTRVCLIDFDSWIRTVGNRPRIVTPKSHLKSRFKQLAMPFSVKPILKCEKAIEKKALVSEKWEIITGRYFPLYKINR